MRCRYHTRDGCRVTCGPCEVSRGTCAVYVEERQRVAAVLTQCRHASRREGDDTPWCHEGEESPAECFAHVEECPRRLAGLVRDLEELVGPRLRWCKCCGRPYLLRFRHQQFCTRQCQVRWNKRDRDRRKGAQHRRRRYPEIASSAQRKRRALQAEQRARV